MIKARIVITLLMLLVSAVARAELRLWTDKRGNSIEAEFVKVLSNEVVLRKTNGQQISVPRSGLCDEDQTYLEYAIPLKINLDVKIHRDMNIDSSFSSSSDNIELDYTTRTEKIKGSVTIEKRSRDPSARPLTAYLFVLGMDLKTEESMIVGKSNHQFSFAKQKKSEFTSEQFSVTYTRSTMGDEGIVYEGYLVLVIDGRDHTLSIRGSRSLYEKNADKIRNAKSGNRFDRNLNLISEAE